MTRNEAMREGLVAGSLASLLSTLVLAWAGRREIGRAAAPVNAVSHWAWEDEALQANRPTGRHTLTGYAIHHGASLLWATLHALARDGRPPTMGSAAATAVAAAVVDLRLTPERLTPGFERRLSNGAIVTVYASFAVGLLAGAKLLRGREMAAAAPPRQAFRSGLLVRQA